MIQVIGIPYDEDSSFLKGCRLAPAAIRDVFHSPATNTVTENGIELGERIDWAFADDLVINPEKDIRELIEATISGILSGGDLALSLGGDHSITFPILRAYARQFGPVNVLHLDAHSDLYDEFEGNRYSHACPFARAHEEGLIRRQLQVGIRTLNHHQNEQVKQFAIEVIPMRDWIHDLVIDFSGPVYVTVDLDVLDPAFAPGISHYEPGGASVRQLIDLIQNIDAKIIGADVVELNPTRDKNELTSMVAAKLMKELLAKMLDNPTAGC